VAGSPRDGVSVHEGMRKNAGTARTEGGGPRFRGRYVGGRSKPAPLRRQKQKRRQKRKQKQKENENADPSQLKGIRNDGGSDWVSLRRRRLIQVGSSADWCAGGAAGPIGGSEIYAPEVRGWGKKFYADALALFGEVA
jgi:hypothetical protein